MTKFNRNITRKPSVEKPWLGYYSKDALELSVSTKTIYEFLLEKNCDFTNDIAILYQDIQITYGKLFRQIDRCTKALMALGVKQNDVVTVGLISIPEVIYLVFAINRIGAISNLINPMNDADSISVQLNETKSKWLFMYSGAHETMRKVLNNTTVQKAVIVSPVESLSGFNRFCYHLRTIGQHLKSNGIVLTWKRFIKEGTSSTLPIPSRAEGDYAIISHTGGTTGIPKGVVCTNENILAIIQQSLVDRLYKRQDCMMSVLPPFINYSLVNTLLEPLCYGLKTLLIPRFYPEKTVDYINRYHVNHIISIPAYWAAFLNIPHVEDNDFSQLGFICSGGDYLDPLVESGVNRLIKKCGAKTELMKGMGMTETTSVVASTYPCCNPINSVGIPCVLNNCKIIDVDDGEELEFGKTGEICFSGPSIMVGYYDQPSATDDMIHTEEDGSRWLHTGDLGYMREDGAIFVGGRMKRIIMQKDEQGMVSKVFPEWIEKVIDGYDGVKSCCVIGVSHKQRINTLKAFVELDEGTPIVDKEKLLEWCRKHLASYMVPQEVEIITCMPRTERGKIDYRAFEKQYSSTNQNSLEN